MEFCFFPLLSVLIHWVPFPKIDESQNRMWVGHYYFLKFLCAYSNNSWLYPIEGLSAYILSNSLVVMAFSSLLTVACTCCFCLHLFSVLGPICFRCDTISYLSICFSQSGNNTRNNHHFENTVLQSTFYRKYLVSHESLYMTLPYLLLLVNSFR